MTLRVVTPATSQSLLDPATAMAEMGVTDAAQEARIEALVARVSSQLAGLCGRPEGFGRATWDEQFRLPRSADRRDRPSPLLLTQDLEPEVDSVTKGGVPLDASLWELDGSRLYRLDADCRIHWSGTVIVVRYAAGFTLPDGAPGLLQAAALALLRQAWFSAGRDSLVRAEEQAGVGRTEYFQTAGGGRSGSPDPDVAAAVGEYGRKTFA